MVCLKRLPIIIWATNIRTLCHAETCVRTGLLYCRQLGRRQSGHCFTAYAAHLCILIHWRTGYWEFPSAVHIHCSHRIFGLCPATENCVIFNWNGYRHPFFWKTVTSHLRGRGLFKSHRYRAIETKYFQHFVCGKK